MFRETVFVREGHLRTITTDAQTPMWVRAQANQHQVLGPQSVDTTSPQTRKDADRRKHILSEPEDCGPNICSLQRIHLELRAQLESEPSAIVFVQAVLQHQE